jgi:hypothetical protein
VSLSLLADCGQRPYNPGVLPVLIAAVAATCTAHPATLDREVGRRAIPWLPPDLARQIVRHEGDFNAGAAAAARWNRTFHQPGGKRGLEVAIRAQCERLAAAIRARTPFSEVVAGFGSLAHLAVDLDAPFLDANVKDAYAHAFASYLPLAAPRIPIVFYGQQRAVVLGAARGLPPFLSARRREAAFLADFVREDLDRVGGPTSWERLDDRSSTFGVASLLLNHAATDFAILASWVWSHAGGLVPDIPMQHDMILVWKGEPQPREAPVSGFSLRQARP